MNIDDSRQTHLFRQFSENTIKCEGGENLVMLLNRIRWLLNKSDLFPYILLTAAYIITGKSGVLLALPPANAAPIFLPAGIAVAAALIAGRRTLPWIFIAALVVAAQSNLWAALIIAAASTLQAAIGGRLLRHFLGYPTTLDQKSDVLLFLFATPFICLSSAALSVTGLWALGIIDSPGLPGSFATWWLGDTLGVMVMFPLTLIVSAKPRALWRSRLSTVFTPVVLFLAVFIFIYIKASQWEYTASLSDFRQLSQQSVDQIQGKLDEQTSLLEQVDAFVMHDTSGHVTPAEFHHFVQIALQRFPMIQALEWIPFIKADQRAAFVETQHLSHPEFDIRERTANGRMLHAAERDSFYPVTYLEPFAGNEPAWGFDLASNHERKETINRAKQTGSIVASSAVKLVQEKQQQAGVLLLLATKPHDEHSDIVLTVLRMGDFIEKTLRNTNQMLYVRLTDLDDQKTIYTSFAAQQALYVHNFDFATRHYRLETAPTPAYYAQHSSWQSWFVLILGNLFTGLFAAFLLIDTGHAARIESEVIDRTRRLTQSESRFRFMLENSPISVRITTLQTGQIVFANQAYSDLIVVPADQLIGLNLDKFYINSNGYKEIIEKVGKGERVINKLVELNIPNNGSATKWALASYLPLEFEQQQAILGWFYDITEQKHYEAQISTLVYEQRAMLENDLVGIVKVKDRHILWANPCFEHMLGYNKREMTGQPTQHNFISEEACREFGEQAYPLLHAGKIYHTRLEHRRKDGSLIWVNVSGAMLSMTSGESLWTFLDITDRKQAETALQNSNQRLNLLLDSMAEGAFGIDRQGHCTFVNQSFLRMLGYDRADQIIGRHLHELIHHSHRDGTNHAVSECSIYQSLSHHDGEHCADDVFWRSDSTALDVEYWSRPIENNGMISGAIVTFIDITRRREMEARVHQLAFYDALTLLPNRRLLDERLSLAMANSRRSGRYGALLFLDMDNFKPLNDTHGHSVGDLLLIEVAHRLKSCMREIDTVARFGGDEFVVMLGDLNVDKTESALHAESIAEKIHNLLAEPYRLTICHEGVAERIVEHHCTASIGVALFLNHSQNEIMKQADSAMYRAKAAGRNQIRFYGPLQPAAPECAFAAD